jgi:hypothetical protein
MQSSNSIPFSMAMAVLFAYRPATRWLGLLIVMLGIPIYWLIGWADRKRKDSSQLDTICDIVDGEHE